MKELIEKTKEVLLEINRKHVQIDNTPWQISLVSVRNGKVYISLIKDGNYSLTLELLDIVDNNANEHIYVDVQVLLYNILEFEKLFNTFSFHCQFDNTVTATFNI